MSNTYKYIQIILLQPILTKYYNKEKGMKIVNVFIRLMKLEKIIQIATDEGDIVLDPFCGSGTTLSKLLNRGIIGTYKDMLSKIIYKKL